MTLNEIAERMGVAVEYMHKPKPTKDIAHDVLAKLPRKAPNSGWLLHYDKDGFWRCVWDGPIIIASFEECVAALASRYLDERD